MASELVVIVIAVVVPLVLWRAWLALFPGISLQADYGIRGGWFGSRVKVKATAARSGRSWSY